MNEEKSKHRISKRSFNREKHEFKSKSKIPTLKIDLKTQEFKNSDALFHEQENTKEEIVLKPIKSKESVHSLNISKFCCKIESEPPKNEEFLSKEEILDDKVAEDDLSKDEEKDQRDNNQLNDIPIKYLYQYEYDNDEDYNIKFIQSGLRRLESQESKLVLDRRFRFYDIQRVSITENLDEPQPILRHISSSEIKKIVKVKPEEPEEVLTEKTSERSIGEERPIKTAASLHNNPSLSKLDLLEKFKNVENKEFFIDLDETKLSEIIDNKVSSVEILKKAPSKIIEKISQGDFCGIVSDNLNSKEISEDIDVIGDQGDVCVHLPDKSGSDLSADISDKLQNAFASHIDSDEPQNSDYSFDQTKPAGDISDRTQADTNRTKHSDKNQIKEDIADQPINQCREDSSGDKAKYIKPNVSQRKLCLCTTETEKSEESLEDEDFDISGELSGDDISKCVCKTESFSRDKRSYDLFCVHGDDNEPKVDDYLTESDSSIESVIDLCRCGIKMSKNIF